MNANNYFHIPQGCLSVIPQGFLSVIGAGVFLGLFAISGIAGAQGANIDSHSQTKINNAKAKAWTDGSIKNKEYQKSVVNVGSKRQGGCSNLNIGTVQADDKKTGSKYGSGSKKPKEIVVATKEVVNVCK